MDVARTRFVRKQAPIPSYALDVRGLKMSYGNTEVLRGIDLKVAPGEVVALLGPNGAGKTTTIEILEGLRCRTSGKVLVLGTDPECGDERWQARFVFLTLGSIIFSIYRISAIDIFFWMKNMSPALFSFLTLFISVSTVIFGFVDTGNYEIGRASCRERV